jgi:hypothetical protein
MTFAFQGFKMDDCSGGSFGADVTGYLSQCWRATMLIKITADKIQHLTLPVCNWLHKCNTSQVIVYAK